MDLWPNTSISSSQQKRTLPSEIEDVPVPIPSIEGRSHRIIQPTSPQPSNSPKLTPVLQLPSGVSRQASPALSITSSLTSIDATPPPFGPDGMTLLDHVPPPAKRRKLTVAEKEVMKAEKAEKERLRAEEQKQKNEMKEEKKRQRDLEKQQKEEERRIKEQEKDEEKQRKNEERIKKEKAQPRILSFFAKPQQPAVPSPAKQSSNPTPSSNTIPPTAISPPMSDYERTFLPFSLPSHGRCAPVNSYDDLASSHFENTFDAISRGSGVVSDPSVKLRDVFLPWVRTRGATHSVKQALSHLVFSIENAINLTGPESTAEVLENLRGIPTKFIYFQEDVRPPYVGTYTKGTTAKNGYQVARNPFRKVRVDTDYSYDSEAEWEEPEEGEDLESEGESDTDSVDNAEDLEGFLDDEEPADGQLRRKFLAGDMDPVCSGIRWESETGIIDDDDDFKLSTLKLQVIDSLHRLPIDPFSTCYWHNEANNALTDITNTNDVASGARLPLQTRTNPVFGGILGAPKGDAPAKSINAKASKPPPRLLSGEDLEEFKRAMEGSPHNKQGLLAILKKDRFPKIPAAVLKDTLGTYGARIGKTEAEKRWVVVNPP